MIKWFKGTPGPWELDGVEIRASASHPSERLCEMAPGFSAEDARLMAAAPKLYAALARLTQAAQDANVGYMDAAVAEGWDALELVTSNSN